MNQYDKLIYDLIFEEVFDHCIDIALYDDMYKYKEFMKRTKNILRKARVSIIDESVQVVPPDSIIWKFRVKK